MITLARSILLVVLALVAGIARADEPADLATVLAGLERAEPRAELARRLARDPVRTLNAVPFALPNALPDGDWETAASRRIQAALGEAIATAFAGARDRRVFFAAAERDGLPPVVLGVLRGLVRALEAAKTTGPVAADQGAADPESFLRTCVRFEDSVDVRVLACETLGRFSPSAPNAEALVQALGDADGRVRSSAASTLTRLAGRDLGDRPAWDAWARQRGGAPDLVAPFDSEDRRERAQAAVKLRRAIVAQPAETLTALHAALAAREEPPGGSSAMALQTAVEGAFVAAKDVAPFLAAAPEAHEVIASGIARGIGARAAPFAKRPGAAPSPEPAGDADDEEHEGEPPTEAEPAAETAEPDAAPQRVEMLEALSALAQRPEPLVRRETFRALPALLPALDATWAQLLSLALADPDAGVRDGAWATLKLITGQALPQSSVAWQRWWTRHDAEHRGPPESGEGEAQ